MTDPVDAFLKKAQISLQAAQRDVDAGDPMSAMNRAYYACFHAATAILEREGIETKTHKGTHGKFYKHFVEDGPLESRYANTIQYLFSNRLEADYFRDDSFSIEDGREAVADAESFVQAVQDALKPTE